MLERSAGIGHLVSAGRTERGTYDPLNNVWVINIEHPGSKAEQAIRIQTPVALQRLRREITHVGICGGEQPSNRERVEVVSLDAVLAFGPVRDHSFQVVH